MDWTDTLRELLEPFTKAKVGRRLGWTPQRISNMLNSGQLPNVMDAIKLSRFLGKTVEEIFGNGAATQARPARMPAKARPPAATPKIYSLRAGKYRPGEAFKLIGAAEIIEAEDRREPTGWVPLISPVAAGQAKEAHDQSFLVGAAERFIRFETRDRRAFALRVDGDSMSPDFRHGDLIVVSPRARQESGTFRDGMLAVVIFGADRSALFKLAHWDKAVLRLESINETFAPFNLPKKELVAVFPLIGLVKMGS